MSPPPEAADQVGAATLERMAAAPRYNRWMFDRLRPWVGRRSRVAPPAHSHRSAALVRSAGTAVPAGAAAPLADRSVAHRHRRGAGMMSRQQSTDDVLLSVIVPAYNEAATIEATVRQLKQVPLRV